MKISRLQKWIIYAVLAIGSVGTLYPFAWMFGAAFKTYKDIFTYPPRIFPAEPVLDSIRELFVEHNFSRYMLNSAIVATTVTFAALLFHAMAAYALARLRFPGRNLIFVFIISTLMIPIYAILVPRYMIIEMFGWVDTYAGLIIPAIPHAFGIFALRQFFYGIPQEFDEAAKMDGASKVRIFFTIILPLSQGILVTLGVLFFMVNWDSFIWPLIATTSDNMRLIQVGIAGFMDPYTPQWNLVLAGSAVSSVPILVLFLSLQRFVIEGIKTSGVKG